RLTGISKHTILSVLETVGTKCARLLDNKIRNIPVESIEADEIWCFVRTKQRFAQQDEEGDQYTFLGNKSKLVLSHHIGKRDAANTQIFIRDLRQRVSVRPQLTSDGFNGYPAAVLNTFLWRC